MNDFQITYEITKPDWAEATSLLHGRKFHYEMWVFWAAAVLLLALPVALRSPEEDSGYPFLVVPFGLFLFYYGLLFLFPSWNAGRSYRYTGLAGRSFTACFSPETVKVSGANVQWVHPWTSYRLIKESGRIFPFYDGLTLFIFAKRYFTPDQISGIQQLIKASG